VVLKTAGVSVCKLVVIKKTKELVKKTAEVAVCKSKVVKKTVELVKKEVKLAVCKLKVKKEAIKVRKLHVEEGGEEVEVETPLCSTHCFAAKYPSGGNL
jgi:hypothetical protein